jgi:Tfp pilus assembly protein PilN
MLLASAAVSAVLVATLGGLIYLAMMDRAQSAQLRGEVAQLDRQVRAAALEQKRIDAILRKPENSNAVELSVFINTLLLHKGISWSRLFSDLEKTIPYDVKLMSLSPSLDSQNKVVLDISVAAEKPESLLEFAKALEKSSAFRDVYPHNTQQPTQSEPFYRGRVTVNYAQKL